MNGSFVNNIKNDYCFDKDITIYKKKQVIWYVKVKMLKTNKQRAL